MASLLLLIKILHGGIPVGGILRAGGFAGGYRRVVDEFIGGAIFLQPADDNHSFGHVKLSPSRRWRSVYLRFGTIPVFDGYSTSISPTPMIQRRGYRDKLALICTIILVSFQRWVVRRTQSQAVRADMLHYQSDVMMNGAILLALGLSWYGWHRADALFALGIGIYILYSALRMGYEAVQSLLDRALPDEERQEIIDIVTSWPGVSGAHDLRTRQSGPTRFIQIHLEMEDSLPLVQAHMVADQVEQAILRRFPGSDVLSIRTLFRRTRGVNGLCFHNQYKRGQTRILCIKYRHLA